MDVKKTVNPLVQTSIGHYDTWYVGENHSRDICLVGMQIKVCFKDVPVYITTS